MTLCIKTSKQDGELIRKFLYEKDLLDSTFKIKNIDNDLIIPIKKQLSKSELSELEELKIVFTIIDYAKLINARVLPKSHLEILSRILSEEELVFAPRSFDTIGDIVVIEISEQLWDKRIQIGNSIIEAHPSIKTVFAKSGKITGVSRIRPIEFLSGEEKTKTIYTEHGSRLAIDIVKAYFSPRLSEEHNRIANQVKPDEIVVDLFCGVGPFVIPIAKRSNSTLYAIDINPDAISLLQENIKLNKLIGEIKPICGDSRVVVKEQNLANIADRVIMNLPGYAIDFIDVACDVLKKSGGVIHFFEFIKDEDPEKIIVENFTTGIQKNKREIKEILQVKRVRMSAPRQWQMVVDAIVK
ncbi:MAG: class I SAM-dependent methyltransferase family protein [Candidatus Heimdallarchaeota archaeon]|nr:class I SAM-dependent methyltransferase family protein [Candidatus Heimdallarchaeota archaeon]MBY8994974.1 class I SAM-dependent methyltransferase family protein [Candidatus Heimdallarchaeota archaeon]